MKIRLMGTEDECRTVAGRLAAIVDVLEVSEPRANRGGSLLVRVYVEACVPASSPGQVVPWPTAEERDKAAAALRAMSADDRAMLIWQLAGYAPAAVLACISARAARRPASDRRRVGSHQPGR